MKITNIQGTSKNGNAYPTQVYDLDGRKVRIHYVQHRGPHLYLIDRNINVKTSEGKPNWESRPDMDTYEFVTKAFNFLIPSFARYKDKEGKMQVLTGARGGRAFLASEDKVRSSLRDFSDNREIWKRRNITRKDRTDYIVARHVTECIVYDEADWQRDPPKFVTKEVDGVKKRVCLDEGTRPQPIARGISACSEGDTFIRREGNLKAKGRAFSHYKHKFGTSSYVSGKISESTSQAIKDKFAGKSDQEIIDMLSEVN